MTPNIDDVIKKVLAYGEARALAAELYRGDGVSRNVRQAAAALDAVREALSPTPPAPDPREVHLVDVMSKVEMYVDACLASANSNRETYSQALKRMGKAKTNLTMKLTVLIQDAVDLQEARDFAKSQKAPWHDYPDAWFKLNKKVIG